MVLTSNFFLMEQPTDIAGVLNLRQFHVTKSSYTKRKYVFKLTNVAPDSKPASPSPASPENKKTEFLIQADDQPSFELWKNKLENVTRPSEDSSTVSCPYFWNYHFEIFL